MAPVHERHTGMETTRAKRRRSKAQSWWRKFRTDHLQCCRNPTDQPSADGIDFQDNDIGTVRNSATGAISGARHGIAGGTGTTVDVTNETSGAITGRDGSGVGLDGSGTVVNSGTITGTIDSTSARGDGDGVDIDFTGTVTNHGTIQGLGAKGADSGGRANAGEGLSLGGGTVDNDGIIRSAALNPDGVTANTGGAIVVNNDGNANRSGSAATTITNYAGATITGGRTTRSDSRTRATTRSTPTGSPTMERSRATAAFPTRTGR